MDLDGRDADALLIDLGRLARHAARHHAADIGPMGAHGRKEDQPAVREHRIDDGDVVEVRAAGIRIVDRMTSPGGQRGRNFSIAERTDQGSGTTCEPMSSDCATTWLSGANSPQEKSLAS